MSTKQTNRAYEAAAALAKKLALKQGEQEEAGGEVWQQQVIDEDRELDELWAELREAMSDLGR
jgi:hypothetical protein